MLRERFRWRRGRGIGVSLVTPEKLRTLQRKLQQEGTTFEEVVESVRRDLAQDYVRSGDFDLLEITYLMGFSTLPAFSRAYKTWTGQPPSEHLPLDRHEIS